MKMCRSRCVKYSTMHEKLWTGICVVFSSLCMIASANNHVFFVTLKDAKMNDLTRNLYVAMFTSFFLYGLLQFFVDGRLLYSLLKKKQLHRKRWRLITILCPLIFVVPLTLSIAAEIRNENVAGFAVTCVFGISLCIFKWLQFSALTLDGKDIAAEDAGPEGVPMTSLKRDDV